MPVSEIYGQNVGTIGTETANSHAFFTWVGLASVRAAQEDRTASR